MSDDSLIGVGRTAEVYAVDSHTVAKVMLPGFDPRMLELEVLKTQAAHDAGVNAPATHGEYSFGGRPGHLFDQIDGHEMLEDLQRRPWAYRSYASMLARLHAGMHTRRSTELPPVKDLLAAKIDAAEPLDESTRLIAKDMLLALDDGHAVLHGDFHPGNVIVSSDGPVVIDWLDASRGPAEADVARTLALLSPAGIPLDTPRRPLLTRFVNAFRRRYTAAYLEAGSVDAAGISAWRVPVIAGRLSEGIEHEIEPILSELARLTR
jgi:Ser/Thr protein kinase RdoA (MazF antagonist)